MGLINFNKYLKCEFLIKDFILRTQLLNLFSLVLFVIILTACSSTRILYTFVDSFIEDEINYFLDLDKEEMVELSQQVSEMVIWHKKFMLPKYSSYMTNAANMLEMEQYRSSDILKVLTNGRSLIEETVTGLTPYASKFLIKYNKVEDINFMEKRMLTRRQKRINELSKSEDILYKERLQRLASNFNRFLGDLNDEQIILLELHARATLKEPRIRLHNRTLRQKVFIRFLRTKPKETELTSYLNKLLLRGYLITNPNYFTFSENSLNRFGSLLTNILAISSKKQKETTIRKLREYANDFKTVSLRGNVGEAELPN